MLALCRFDEFGFSQVGKFSGPDSQGGPGREGAGGGREGAGWDPGSGHGALEGGSLPDKVNISSIQVVLWHSTLPNVHSLYALKPRSI